MWISDFCLSSVLVDVVFVLCEFLLIVARVLVNTTHFKFAFVWFQRLNFVCVWTFSLDIHSLNLAFGRRACLFPFALTAWLIIMWIAEFPLIRFKVWLR
jgi:hypothetical protein